MNQLMKLALVLLGALSIIALLLIGLLAYTEKPIPDALVGIGMAGPTGIGALLANSGRNAVGQADQVTVQPPAEAPVE